MWWRRGRFGWVWSDLERSICLRHSGSDWFCAHYLSRVFGWCPGGHTLYCHPYGLCEWWRHCVGSFRESRDRVLPPYPFWFSRRSVPNYWHGGWSILMRRWDRRQYPVWWSIDFWSNSKHSSAYCRWSDLLGVLLCHCSGSDWRHPHCHPWGLSKCGESGAGDFCYGLWGRWLPGGN